MKIKELKLRIKKTVKEIRQMKSERKSSEYGYVSGLDSKRALARHLHIAYCLLRGRKYEEIEPSCREGNTPSEEWVEQIMEEYSCEKDVRDCA